METPVLYVQEQNKGETAGKLGKNRKQVKVKNKR